MKLYIAATALAVALTGCASSSESIQGTYVSPLTYSNLDCDQLRGELTRVSARVREVSGAQDSKHRNDQVATGVGVVLFWPALFFLMGSDHKAELQGLKGQYDALDQTAISKKCPVASEMHVTTPANVPGPKTQAPAVTPTATHN